MFLKQELLELIEQLDDTEIEYLITFVIELFFS